MKRRYMKLLCLLLTIPTIGWGWGGPTHKLINKEAIKHLPPSLTFFLNNAQWISDHAADADIRKSADPNEAPKHFIDIEDYPEFAAGTLSHDIDTLIAEYGRAKVFEIGVVPWASIWSLDSLTDALQRGDSTAALQFAADLGHYVGDAHQPLHVTANYDGQMTGNKGVHARYESTMLDSYNYLSQITVKTPQPIHYVADPIDFIFDYIYHGNGLVDSILAADNHAKALAGGTSGSSYYAALWAGTDSLTQHQISDATVALACLWYTAAVNAGMVSVAGVTGKRNTPPLSFSLLQNYPNPFNPATKIGFDVSASSNVTLTVYDILGRKVAVLVNGEKAPGRYEVTFDAEKFPSGVYLYRLREGTGIITKCMILMK